MRDAICPECGCPLFVEVLEEENSGKIVINLFCKGFADDVYNIKINTHLSNEKLREWNILGSTKKATMKLEKRTRDPYYSMDLSAVEIERYQEK
jgi:hypothetical protein